jgi:hypothetical protein
MVGVDENVEGYERNPKGYAECYTCRRRVSTPCTPDTLPHLIYVLRTEQTIKMHIFLNDH